MDSLQRLLSSSRLVLLAAAVLGPGCGGSVVPTAAQGDTTAPTTTAAPLSGRYAPPLTVTLTADEAATIYYSSDGTPASTASPAGASPVAVPLTATSTLSFFAVDAAGNVGAVRSETYTLDGEPPTTSVDVAARAFNAAFDVVITASETATVYHTLDGTTPTTASASGPSPKTVNIPGGGSATLSFFAIDTVGNAEASIHTVTYTWDNLAPTVAADVAVGTLTAATTVTFTASEAASLYATTDGVDPTTALTPTANSVAILIAAATTVKILAVDAAGNHSGVASWAYGFDDQHPSVTSFSPAAGLTDVRTLANIVITFSEAMNRAGVQAALSVDDGANVPLAFHWHATAAGEVLFAWPAHATDAADVNTPFAAATAHAVHLTVAATDLAGNALAAPLDFAFATLDNRAPVITLDPDPAVMASPGLTEVSATFDRAMDTGAGRVTITYDLFGGGDFPVDVNDGAELAWVGDTKLVLTFDAGLPAPTEAAYVVFSDLHKTNGDAVEDVALPLVVARPGGGDTTPPVLDMPTSGVPVSIDPRLAVLWFSEVLDPATLHGISAAEAISGAVVDLEPQLVLLGRAVRFSTAGMLPGVTYTIHISATLTDAAGNAAADELFDVEIRDPLAYGAPRPWALTTGATAVALTAPELGVEVVGGYVPGSISAGDLRLFVTASGEPVRGLHASLPPAMLPDTTVRLRLAAGTPPLSPLTEYTLAVSDIDSAGGVNTFGGAPVTVSFTTAGQGDDSRPLFVPGAEVSLEVSGGGQIIIDGKLEISDDDPSLLGVELWHDGIFVTQMSAAPGQPGHFVVNDADGLVPGGVSIPEGWSDVTVAVDDGTHQVSMLMPVYLMPDAEIPTVTAPLAGALVDPAATGTLQLTWSHTPGLADRQLLAVADMTAIGGPPQFVGVTIVDPDATAFDLGGRWGALLQPGRTYLAAVIKQVARNGMYSAGTASIFGRSMVTFAVVDPTLGAISGSLTLRSPLGAAPLVMLFDSMPGPGTPPSAYVAARPVVGDELTWTYELANLADLSPGYFVLTRVDVLNNTVDGQPLTEEDDLMAYYGMPGAPAPVAITAGAEVTGIDLPVDNWPGRVHALLTSAQTIAGDLLFVLCPDTATSPPFDSSCSVVTQRTPLAANSADITAYNVGDGVYTAWVAFDQDGDGDLDLGLAREAAESPFTVNGDTQEVTFAIPAPPTGGIDGSVATPAGALGVAVVVYGRGVSPGPGVQPLYAVAATSADGGLSWSYSISYVAAGDYDVYAFIDLDDTPGPPDAVALPQPAAVTVATSVVVQDFTLPAGGFAGTVATPGGALGVMVAVYARGVTPGPGVPPLYAVAAVDLGGGLSWSYSIGSVTDGDYDVYAFIDLDGAGGPDGVAVPGPAPLTVAGGVVSQSFTF